MNETLNSPACPKRRDADLTSLAAGDLPGWKAARLRRHLRACPECAATFAEIDALFAHMKTVSMTTSGELPNRIWAKIESETAASPTPRRVRPALVLSLAASGTALATCAAIALLTPGAPLRPAPVFAEVEKAMQETHTVEYHMAVHTHNTQQHVDAGSTVHVAASTNPPAIMTDIQYEKTPQRLQHYSDLTTIWDCVEGDWEGHRAYYISAPNTQAAQALRVRQIMTFSPVGSPYFVNVVFGPAQRTILDGHEVFRFDGTPPLSLTGPKKSNYTWKATVWVDPRTLRFVRSDSTRRSFDGNLHEETCIKDYAYDRPIDGSFLSSGPPIHKTVTLIASTSTVGMISAPTSSVERQSVMAVVTAALTACDRRDWTAFSAQCDRGFPVWGDRITLATHLPLSREMTEATWRSLLSSPGFSPGPIKEVVQTGLYDYVRHNESERMPATLPLNVYIAKTDTCWFFLKRTSDGTLKIFDASFGGRTREVF